MVTNLRKCLTLLAILCGLSASAQYDLFWGVGPNQYYINYNDGFVGKLQDQKLTLISSDDFFNTEVVDLANSTDGMTLKINEMSGQIEKIRTAMGQIAEGRDMVFNGFVESITEINGNFENLLKQYDKFATILEDRYNELQKSPRRIREAAYSFKISEIMNSHTLAKASIDISSAYMGELAKAMEDLNATSTKTGKELTELLKEYDRQVDVRIDMYNYYVNYWNQNGPYMSVNMILEFGQKLQKEVEYINKLIAEEPKNPTEAMDYIINAANNLFDSSVASYNDAQNYLNELYKTIPPLAKFSEVLYAGVEGNPFGLYYYIKDNDGVLTIPSTQTYYDASDYPVTGIEGKIFTKFYEAANPQCRKVVIPATITSLSKGAFAVDGLETVEVLADKVPAMSDDCFTSSVYSKATLIVPDGMTKAYAAAPGWKNFANIKVADTPTPEPEPNPGSSAIVSQGETFKGFSDKHYLINYEKGLIGEYNDKNMTLKSLSVFHDEFLKPLASTSDKMSDDLKLCLDNIDYLKSQQANLYTQSDKMLEGYKQEMTAINNKFEELLNNYNDFADALEKAYNQAGKSPRRKSRAAATFGFGIDNIMADYWVASAMVDFTTDYVLKTFKSTEDAANTCKDCGLNAVDIIDLYYSNLNILIDNYNKLVNFFNANIDTLTADELLDMGKTVQEQVETVTQIVKDEPLNPIEQGYYAIQVSEELLQKSFDGYNNAVADYNLLFDKLAPFMLNFPSTIYSGTKENPSGIYYYIKNNDGVLNIPSAQIFENNEYVIDGVDGNIFTHFYDNTAPVCRKVVIPATITNLSNGAFAVEGLETVEVLADKVPAMTDDCFTSSVYSKATLIVPDGMAKVYAAAPGWRNFANIKSAAESGIESVTADGVSIRVENGVIYVDGAEHTCVSVYNVNGATVYSGNEREITLPARGIYIVRAGNKIIKVAY